MDAGNERRFAEETASDLLAAAVTGPGYAFMAMLDYLGTDLTSLFQSDTSGNEADFGVSFTTGIYESVDRLRQPQLWIVRLRCITTFLRHYLQKASKPQDRPALGADILDAVDAAVNAILKGLISRASHENRVWLAAWDEMTQRMTAVLESRDSQQFVADAVTAAEKEGEKLGRGRDAKWEDEAVRVLTIGALIDRMMENPRLLHTVLLRDQDVQKDLQAEELWPASEDAKAEELEAIGRRFKECLMTPDRGPARFTQKVEAVFCKHYLRDQVRTLPKELFCNVYDIPWQSAIITTADFLPLESAVKGGTAASASRSQGSIDQTASTNGSKLPFWRRELSNVPRIWLRGLERMNWLGREYFNLALEFHVWNQRQAGARHDACVRVVHGLVADTLAYHYLFGSQRESELLQSWLGTPKGPFKAVVERVAAARQNSSKLPNGSLAVLPGLWDEARLGDWLAGAQAFALTTPNNWSGHEKEQKKHDATFRAEKDEVWDECAKRQILQLLEMQPKSSTPGAGYVAPCHAGHDLMSAVCERIFAIDNEAQRHGGYQKDDDWAKRAEELRMSLQRRWCLLQRYVAWSEKETSGKAEQGAGANRSRRDLYNKVGASLGQVHPRGGLDQQNLGTAMVPLTVSRTFRIERVSLHGRLPPTLDAAGPLEVLGTTPWVCHTDSRAWPGIGLSEATPLNVSSCIPLLGRYDMMRVEQARPTGPHRLPNVHVADWHREWPSSTGRVPLRGDGDSSASGRGCSIPGGEETIPFFVRQQFGLPFSRSLLGPKKPSVRDRFRSATQTELKAQVGWCGWISGVQMANPDFSY
jgi:hypothetical protein